VIAQAVIAQAVIAQAVIAQAVHVLAAKSRGKPNLPVLGPYAWRHA